ncbi:hypothetical protein B0H10DRAFT_1777336, partial [Mycena sp. CBHHK59/15]
DVIKVWGHRLSTAEIKSALIMHKGVAETAVIGTADEPRGQAVFVTLKPCELVLQVRKVMGPFAAPKIYIVGDLPKTRSGKIMRRIMHKIVAGEGDQLGDLSTVAGAGRGGAHQAERVCADKWHFFLVKERNKSR